MQNWRIWGLENPHTWSYRSQCTHNEWLFGTASEVEAPLPNIFLKMEAALSTQLSHHVQLIMVLIWMMFATHFMLKSFNCLERLIAVYFAEIVIAIRRQEAAIWHRWTIFCGPPLKKSYMTTYQRKLRIWRSKLDPLYSKKCARNGSGTSSFRQHILLFYLE